MRAVVLHAAHDLRVEERDLPSAPGPGEVLVRVGRGGICGSDLHYFHDGGIGDSIRVREPIALGHEVAGTVETVGAGVTAVKVGDRVAVNPSRPCGRCRFCRDGLANHCLDMRFFGSAMRFPHVQGAFREALVCDEAQAVPIAEGLSLDEAAMTEPLAVCVHAARRAGDLVGARVLVAGCGPIGALTIVAARRAGAAEIVATDVAPAALAFALRIGADSAIDARDGAATAPFALDKGRFDVAFECSGAAPALRAAIECTRPRGVVVQVGMGGDMPVPVQAVTTKEIDLRGAFRFHAEFRTAVEWLGKGLVDVKPLISATLPFERAREAFDLASDRSRAMKVQLAF